MKIRYLFILFTILFIGFKTVQYRTSSTPIQAVAIELSGRELIVPLRKVDCTLESSCTVSVGKDGLIQVALLFEPPNSPYGNCVAQFNQETVDCRLKQNFYYRFGDGIRPYAVITSLPTASIPPTLLARMYLETIGAQLGMGYPTHWFFFNMIIACLLTFSFIQSILKGRLNKNSNERSQVIRSLTFKPLFFVLLILGTAFGAVALSIVGTVFGVILD